MGRAGGLALFEKHGREAFVAMGKAYRRGRFIERKRLPGPSRAATQPIELTDRPHAYGRRRKPIDTQQ